LIGGRRGKIFAVEHRGRACAASVALAPQLVVEAAGKLLACTELVFAMTELLVAACLLIASARKLRVRRLSLDFPRGNITSKAIADVRLLTPLRMKIFSRGEVHITVRHAAFR
jgi:hypothetical protein